MYLSSATSLSIWRAMSTVLDRVEFCYSLLDEQDMKLILSTHMPRMEKNLFEVFMNVE